MFAVPASESYLHVLPTLFDTSKSVMIMDTFNAFHSCFIPYYAFIGFQTQSNFADRVFNKTRIIIGLLSYKLFIRTFQKTVNRRACSCISNSSQFFQPNHFSRSNFQFSQSSLVMSAISADLFRAWAQGLNRNLRRNAQ